MANLVTCSAPVNIAVIKYWGKKDENLILPLNDSISFTLSQEQMCAKTSVMISPKFESDRIWLNGKEEDINNPRIANCLREIRQRASTHQLDSALPSFDWPIHICSENNFPTAAGLASSAAGYACLVCALGRAFHLEGDLSPVARLGSGSACRSLSGGLVRWVAGQRDDGTDSVAVQVAPKDHFEDVKVVICIANSGRKKTGSSEGMRRSVETSFLLKCRVRESVNQRIEGIMQAIKSKDWPSFCELTMRDSNELHAVCLDTYPPCAYMNDTSHAVADAVHRFNQRKKMDGKEKHMICYTFDAGPNACLFVPASVLEEVRFLLDRCFPREQSWNGPEEAYWRGAVFKQPVPLNNEDCLCDAIVCEKHSIKYFLVTSIGDGPRQLKCASDHLLNAETGLPDFFK